LHIKWFQNKVANEEEKEKKKKKKSQTIIKGRTQTQEIKILLIKGF